MSPLCIRTVLDIQTMADHCDFNKEGIKQAKDQGLATVLDTDENIPGEFRIYKLTPKGEAFFEALVTMPIPKMYWRVSGFGSEF